MAARRRTMQYINDFVEHMPPDSGTRKLHNEVLALHELIEELVLYDLDFWG